MSKGFHDLPPMLSGAEVSLTGGVRSGLVASSAARFALLGVQLVSTALLARLLTPADYGLAALVMAVTGFAAILVDAGVASAVIQRENLTPAYLSTAIWFSAAIGASVAILVVVAGVPLSLVFDQPELVPLTALASITILLTFDAVPTAILKRAMAFGVLARISTASMLAGVAVTLLVAWAGGGAYSLVLGPVLQRLLAIVLTWRAVQWWPARVFDRADVRHIWRFGRGLMGFFVLSYWAGVLDRFVVGKTVNLAALGQYNRASNLINLPLQQTTGILSSVFYPAFARLQADEPRLREAWRRLIYVAWAAGLPIGATLFVVRDELVRVLYGTQWQPVGPLLAWMSIAIPFALLASTVSPVFEARGRTGLQFRLGLVASLSSVGILVVSAPFGLLAIARAYALRAAMSAVVNFPQAMQLVGLRWGSLRRTLRGTSLATVAAAAATVALKATIIDAWRVTIVVKLGLLTVSMLSITCIMTLLLDRRQVAQVLGGRVGIWLRVAAHTSAEPGEE